MKKLSVPLSQTAKVCRSGAVIGVGTWWWRESVNENPAAPPFLEHTFQLGKDM